MSILHACVSDGENGPFITLSGEADTTTVAELSDLVAAQIPEGTRYLTIDAAGLVFADSAALRVLIFAARTVRQRGGGLVLLRPQSTVARAMEIMCADQLVTIEGETRIPPPG